MCLYRIGQWERGGKQWGFREDLQWFWKKLQWIWKELQWVWIRSKEEEKDQESTAEEKQACWWQVHWNPCCLSQSESIIFLPCKGGVSRCYLRLSLLLFLALLIKQVCLPETRSQQQMCPRFCCIRANSICWKIQQFILFITAHSQLQFLMLSCSFPPLNPSDLICQDLH